MFLLFFQIILILANAVITVLSIYYTLIPAILNESRLKHIAFVGLNDQEMQVTDLLRERVEMVYGARIIFYPSRNNHETLAAWLKGLAEKYATTTGTERAGETKHREVSTPRSNSVEPI